MRAARGAVRIVDLAPRARRVFDTPGGGTAACGALGAAALLTAAMSVSGHTVNRYMWAGAALLPVVAGPVRRAAGAAARRSRRAFEPVKTLAVVTPTAITGVDPISGVRPPWHTAMQGACVLPIVVTAAARGNPALRGAFPRTDNPSTDSPAPAGPVPRPNRAPGE